MLVEPLADKGQKRQGPGLAASPTTRSDSSTVGRGDGRTLLAIPLDAEAGSLFLEGGDILRKFRRTLSHWRAHPQFITCLDDHDDLDPTILHSLCTTLIIAPYQL